MLMKAHLGGGLYAHVEPDQTMRLTAGEHGVALTPEMFLDFLRYANAVGWGRVIERAAREHRSGFHE